MDDMDILKELIQNKALVSVSNNIVKLEEFVSKQQGYAIEIKDTPDQVIAINLDSNFPAPRKIFNNDKGACKRADFVLFANRGNKNWIVYIEMKGGRSSRKQVRQQLQGAQCFVVYCRAIGKIFWKQKSFLQNWEERFVRIQNANVNKQPGLRSRYKKPSRHSGSKLHDKPENMLTIVMGPGKGRLEFRELVSKP